MRYILIILGIIATSLGAIGVFVPGLPTTPFILLASWLFYKSSPRLREKLHASWLGKYIKNYERQGGLSVKGKITAISLILLAFIFPYFLPDSNIVIFFIKPLTVKIIVGCAGTIGCIVVGFFVPNAKKG